jgi:hypothetical protein
MTNHKQKTVIVEGPAMKSETKDLLRSIMGGEMKNAWQKETRPGQDMRPNDMKNIDRRPREDSFRENYARIFGHE